MNILIIGSGAREHALASALHRSPQQPRIFCYGVSINPGLKQMTQDYWVGDLNDVQAIAAVAFEWQIGLAMIGPEGPLEKGLADALWQKAIPTIGPTKKLAQIETSKSFARDLMKKYKIAGLPKYQNFQDLKGVEEFLKTLGENKYVIKANGLMGGKGVKVAGDHLHSFDEAIDYCKALMERKQTFVIEEKLIGQEFSLMCFCDGEHVIPMPVVQDYKRAYVDDKGPNTGGMGSYTDRNHSLPFLNQDDVERAQMINEQILRALVIETRERYVGVLYGSFIATRDGIYVIEFNARFGDPEVLNVLTILKSDFVTICQNLVTGNLSPHQVQFAHLATVCKYAVPEGYPDNSVTNIPIDISAVKNKSQLYLSAVNAAGGTIYALGSRTAAYVGVGDSLSEAEEIAEKEIRGIAGNLFHREDIGTDRMIKARVDAMRRLRSS